MRTPLKFNSPLRGPGDNEKTYMKNNLTDINTDFAQWYQDIIYAAELADHSPVRGSFIIRPYGYAIWELIQKQLDTRIKETGHQNASFPLFIPQSFLQKEAEHVEGFAPELAVVTHAGGKELEEPLVVRPTSETIIHYMFAKWIKSYRDLPLKINHWANVVRWEMRPRAFLRTTEFFWQEGHTAHAMREEAAAEVQLMLTEYKNLAIDYLAIPVITGRKSEKEKFPGAEETYTFEALMQDGKALQMGTSHLLSQSFAHAFEMKFQDQHGAMVYPYLTSWGATTRLIGAVVMVHGDQKGLVLPPHAAPIQVVIVPITTKNSDTQALMKAVHNLAQELKLVGIRVHVDDREETPGAKFYHWELRGVPLRVEIGPRDLASESCVVSDRLGISKQTVPLKAAIEHIVEAIPAFHKHLYNRAHEKFKSMWHKAATLAEIVTGLELKPGFYQTGWCQQKECEAMLKEHKATTRCLIKEHSFKNCFNCGKPSIQDVLIARSY
jgi:prolyl-tRNA synthetase